MMISSSRRRLSAGLWLAFMLAGCGGESLDLVGTVELQILELAAPVSEVIVDIPVEVAQRVEKGQLLVQLDSEVAQAELEASEAALRAAAAGLTEASGEIERFRRLRSSNVATQQQLDAAQRLYDEALSLQAERQARVAQARKRLSDLSLRASRAGVVDQLPFNVGERVPAGGVLAVMVAADAPWVRVYLPARAVTRAAVGGAARVKVQGLDDWLTGRLVEISRQPAFTPHYALTEKESANLVYESRVEIRDGPANLRPGLAARVRIDLGDGGADG